MFHDPELKPLGSRIVFYDNLRPLWFAALSDDDPELRRLAADSIAIAHRKGMRGLEEAEGDLVKLLQREDSDPRMRRAAAKALVAIDARNAADVLAQHLPDADAQYAQAVEPALARWDYRPMVEQWLSRLEEPATGRVRLLLAIQCLVVVNEQSARDQLVAMAVDPNALATLRVDRLVGTTLLRRHSSEQAIELLQRSVVDQAPTVAGLALRILFEIDPQLVLEHAPQGIHHSDVNIRRVCAEALVVRADEGAIESLASLLDDPHRELRRYISDQLIKLAASDELRKTVIAEASKVAAADRWRGLEQAMSILGTLDHEPSARRMLELLHHKRPEVVFAAAWALREIAVAEVLPEMLEYASDLSDTLIAGLAPHAGIDLQVAQLCQAFGEQRYTAAEPLLRKLVPKFPLAENARSGAIWALGLLHEGKAPPDLPAQLEQRLADLSALFPESRMVKSMSAITLARMQSLSALPTLRKFSMDGKGDPALACVWAIEHLTKEKLPPIAATDVADLNWFLVPIELAEPIERADPNERAKP
jgi:HEAT repeat protein